MVMPSFFQLIEQGLGIAIEHIIAIVVNMGLLIFYAKDFKLGLVMAFLGNALLFMWYFATDLSYATVIILMLLHLIFMALTVYSVRQEQGQGGFV